MNLEIGRTTSRHPATFSAPAGEITDRVDHAVSIGDRTALCGKPVQKLVGMAWADRAIGTGQPCSRCAELAGS